MEQDPRTVVDPRIDSPGREGLTGTAPANLYDRLHDRDHITMPPDGRPYHVQPAWRRDFPIDAPDDQYVERRDFMKFLVLTSTAFTAGQFWIAIQNWWRRRRGQLEHRRIAGLADLTPGHVIAFSYPGEHDRCIATRLPSGEVVAFSQKCTHLSCAVVPRPAEGALYCPCHEGVFDLQTGRPLAGPPRRPLPRVALELRGSDIYAVDVEERMT